VGVGNADGAGGAEDRTDEDGPAGKEGGADSRADEGAGEDRADDVDDGAEDGADGRTDDGAAGGSAGAGEGDGADGGATGADGGVAAEEDGAGVAPTRARSGAATPSRSPDSTAVSRLSRPRSCCRSVPSSPCTSVRMRATSSGDGTLATDVEAIVSGRALKATTARTAAIAKQNAATA
jgi:hypothetical protein